jgi:hypothetical protein
MDFTLPLFSISSALSRRDDIVKLELFLAIMDIRYPFAQPTQTAVRQGDFNNGINRRGSEGKK